MIVEIRDTASIPHSREIWDQIVNASPEGWFWATSAMHDYRLASYEARGHLIADRSFVIVCDGQPCALVPLVIGRDHHDGDIVASYLNCPLPWPMIRPDIAERDAIEQAIFDEIEMRVSSAKATMLRLTLAPAGPGSEMAETFAKMVRKRSFVDNSYVSHWVEISPDTLNNVRERYRRNVRKFWDKYKISILSVNDLPHDFAQNYMNLHVKDAGRVTRSLSTYEMQVELARRGQGFWVLAHNKVADRTVGMLLISVHKNAAYDSSVAVDPEYQNEPVSHLMKWKTIQHLLESGITHYELGSCAFAPTYLMQPTEKNYGISFFKDGWSRGRTKTVWVAEKFYSADAFNRFWEQKRQALLNHFAI